LQNRARITVRKAEDTVNAKTHLTLNVRTEERQRPGQSVLAPKDRFNHKPGAPVV